MQLPSRLEALNRLRQEKAEAAALRADPLGTAVDATQEARARLAALRQQEQQHKQPSQAALQQQQQAGLEDGPSSTGKAADDDGVGGAAGSRHEQAVGAAAAAGEDGTGEGVAAEGDDGGGGAVGDPYAGMNARERKLYELKQKMQQARKANENAVIAERKRQRVSEQQASGPGARDGNGGLACIVGTGR